MTEYTVMVTESNVYICRRHPAGINNAVLIATGTDLSFEEKIDLATEFCIAMNSYKKQGN